MISSAPACNHSKARKNLLFSRRPASFARFCTIETSTSATRALTCALKYHFITFERFNHHLALVGHLSTSVRHEVAPIACDRSKVCWSRDWTDDVQVRRLRSGLLWVFDPARAVYIIHDYFPSLSARPSLTEFHSGRASDKTSTPTDNASQASEPCSIEHDRLSGLDGTNPYHPAVRSPIDRPTGRVFAQR